jgi:hypothetical protein
MQSIQKKRRLFIMKESLICLFAVITILTQLHGQNTTLLGRWANDPSSAYHAMDISGNYAYVSLSNDSTDAIYIIDVSIPSSPQLAAFVNDLTETYGIGINGNYAYLAAGWGAGASCVLYTIDASNPSSPQELGHIFLGTYDVGREVVIDGSYAYVVSGDGINILDVSTPSSPQGLGVYWTNGGYPHHSDAGIAINGSYAYVADGDSGLRIIDVSNPANVGGEVGRYDTGGHAVGVAVSGSYVYMADGEEGLRIIDVSTPSAPQEVGSLDTDGFAKDVTLGGIYAYVADGQNGLRIIDVSKPSLPQEVGFFNTGGYVSGIVVDGSYAYIADRDSGLYIISNDLITDISTKLGDLVPEAFALLQNYPNPFNPTTNIEFSIPKSEFVTLKVYNILGEEVATLVSERLAVGQYRYDWNASSLASGVYLYRIQTQDYVESKKMILMK